MAARKPIPTTFSDDAQAGEPDVAVLDDTPPAVDVPPNAPPPPRPANERSPLDQALLSRRPQNAPLATLWLDAPLTAVPMSMAGANIAELPECTEELATHVAGAIAALDGMGKATADFLAVRNAAQVDPTQTQASAVLLVEGSFEKLLTPALKRLDAAREHVEAQMRSTQQALDAPVKAGAAGGPFASEVRAVFRAMPEGQRMQAINAAIAAGNEVVVHAVLGAPSLLSGLSDDAVRTYTAQFNRVRQPEQVARLALLEKAHAALDRAGRAHVANIERTMGVRIDTVQRVKAQVAKARTVINGLA